MGKLIKKINEKLTKEQKEIEEKIVKLFQSGKIKEGLRLGFQTGLIRARIETKEKCYYCDKQVRDSKKHLCDTKRLIGLLMWHLPGLARVEAEAIVYAGEDADFGQDSKNLFWDKLFEIMNKKDPNWRWRQDKKKPSKQEILEVLNK